MRHLLPDRLFFTTLALFFMAGAPLPGAWAQCPSSFAAPASYPSGNESRSVVIADLNNDGKLDVAAANYFGNDVSVLLGNGDGTLAAPVSYSAGARPLSMAIGDLNGDGRPDLAVANINGDNVSVLLGNGPPNIGTFAAPVNYAAGTDPSSVAIGDLNGDGRPDLAVTSFNSDQVLVLLGNAPPNAGTFAAAVNYDAGGNADCVAIGDLSGDGWPDLAVAHAGDNTVSVLMNSGGTFAAPVYYDLDATPYFVTIGDLNGDGWLDLAAANFSSGTASVLLGNGDGTFAATVNYGAGTQPFSLAIGDLSGDGRPDLAVANRGGNNISVLLGNGNGTFSAAVNHAGGNQPVSVGIGDLDGDGRPDLTVVNQSADTVSVLRNAGLQAVVSQQPADQSVNEGGNAMFSVAATDSTSYRWRRNAVPFVDGGRISGATTNTLSITGVLPGDAGVYDVMIGALCAAGVPSQSAILCVQQSSPVCPADFDNSGVVAVPDIFAFLSAWFAGCP